MRPFWYCASVCCARRHLPPVYRLRPASRPLQPFRPFLPAKRRSRWSGSQRTAEKNITASLPAAIWKTRKRLHYRKQKRKASLPAKSAIKKIKNDLQSPCRKFSGRGFICVYKKLTKEITEKLQNPIANWFQKSYNMVTARANDPAECEIFFFLFFWDIGHRFSSSGCSPSQSWSMCRTGGIPLRVQKSSSVLDELFCIHKSRKNRLLMRESMTLRHFGGQFACFSAKDIYKVWRGGGLYSGWLCGTVYTINL